MGFDEQVAPDEKGKVPFIDESPQIGPRYSVVDADDKYGEKGLLQQDMKVEPEDEMDTMDKKIDMSVDSKMGRH
jgi:hypothetical protein